MAGRIKSKTKGATIKKQGHTTSGKFGTSLSKTAHRNPKEVSAKGK